MNNEQETRSPFLKVSIILALIVLSVFVSVNFFAHIKPAIKAEEVVWITGTYIGAETWDSDDKYTKVTFEYSDSFSQSFPMDTKCLTALEKGYRYILKLGIDSDANITYYKILDVEIMGR